MFDRSVKIINILISGIEISNVIQTLLLSCCCIVLKYQLLVHEKI